MKKMTVAAIALTTSMAAALTAPAFAESRSGNEEERSVGFDDGDAQAFWQAKVSLTQAVAAAEAALNGKVVEARFEKRDVPVWEVDVARQDGTMEAVSVDAATGAVDRTRHSASEGDDEDRSDDVD